MNSKAAASIWAWNLHNESEEKKPASSKLHKATVKTSGQQPARRLRSSETVKERDTIFVDNPVVMSEGQREEQDKAIIKRIHEGNTLAAVVGERGKSRRNQHAQKHQWCTIGRNIEQLVNSYEEQQQTQGK